MPIKSVPNLANVLTSLDQALRYSNEWWARRSCPIELLVEGKINKLSFWVLHQCDIGVSAASSHNADGIQNIIGVYDKQVR